MSLYWYACISINTYHYKIFHISLETVWWALSNTILIVWICPAFHEILVNKAFKVTDGLISQLFVVAFVHPAYMWIALIWGFSAQLSLWKLVHLLWRYKPNKVCNTFTSWLMLVYYFTTGPDTSRSWFLLLYPSQANLSIILPRHLSLLFYLTLLANSLKKWLPDNFSLILLSIASLSRNNSYWHHNMFYWQLDVIEMIVSNQVWTFI